MYVFGRRARAGRACICVAQRHEREHEERKRAPLWTSRALRRPKRSPASSSFPFLRFLPFGEAGIAVSKAAARKSKTKVSFFSLEGPGYGTATIHSLPSLPTPFFSYHHPLRHRLLLSPLFYSYHFLLLLLFLPPPTPFRVRCITSGPRPPFSLPLSFSLLLYALAFVSKNSYLLISTRILSSSRRPDSPACEMRRKSREDFAQKRIGILGGKRRVEASDVNDLEDMLRFSRRSQALGSSFRFLLRINVA